MECDLEGKWRNPVSKPYKKSHKLKNNLCNRGFRIKSWKNEFTAVLLRMFTYVLCNIHVTCTYINAYVKSLQDINRV